MNCCCFDSACCWWVQVRGWKFFMTKVVPSMHWRRRYMCCRAYVVNMCASCVGCYFHVASCSFDTQPGIRKGWMSTSEFVLYYNTRIAQTVHDRGLCEQLSNFPFWLTGIYVKAAKLSVKTTCKTAKLLACIAFHCDIARGQDIAQNTHIYTVRHPHMLEAP